MNGALAAAVVLISRRLYRVEAELDRISALAEIAARSAEAARSNPPLPGSHTAMTNGGAGDMTDLAAEWEQAILPTDS
ncbi:MAG: hypothetical protein ACXVR1_04235 [Solirubrobacteraceae bacterium]